MVDALGFVVVERLQRAVQWALVGVLERRSQVVYQPMAVEVAVTLDVADIVPSGSVAAQHLQRALDWSFVVGQVLRSEVQVLGAALDHGLVIQPFTNHIMVLDLGKQLGLLSAIELLNHLLQEIRFLHGS